jgi:hypothetical protein
MLTIGIDRNKGEGMFNRAYSSMYTGSMMGAGSAMFAVWGYVVANQQPDRVVGFQVELIPYALAKLIGEKQEVIEDVIRKLCEPDPNSRTKVEEGRRLVKVGDCAYRVVNGKMYREIADAEERRKYQRRWVRDKRSGLKKGGGVGPLPNEGPALVAAERGDEEGYDKLAAERVGAGVVPIPESAVPVQSTEVPVPGVPCPVCRGAGKTRNSNFGMDLPCVACGGKGMRKEKGEG